MKKKIVLFAAVLLTVSAFAQMPQGAPQGRPEGPRQGQMPQGMEMAARMAEMTPAQKAQFMTDEMNREVNLTDKQYKKVLALFKRDFKHRDYLENNGGGGMMMGGGPMMGPPPMMMGGPNSSLDDEYFQDQDKKLAKILTPEQHQMWRAKHPIERASGSDDDEDMEFPDFPGGFPGGGPGGPGGFPGGGPF